MPFMLNVCAMNAVEPVKEGVYRRVLLSEYNIRFFKPKKDQCITCNAFNSSSVEERAGHEEQFMAHKKRENDALTAKREDKILSANNSTFRSITFDLEAVLTTPFAGDS